MAIKTTYLISCMILLANCNIHVSGIVTPENCDCEEPHFGSTGHFASGSAHSSQYVLPSGEVVTHSKGSSFSSDGIKKTFEQLKEEANKYVYQKKDTFNVPNAPLPPLVPLHSGFGQDLQTLHTGGFENSQSILNKLGSVSQHIYTGNVHDSQDYYPQLPPTSKVTTTKKEVQVKKVITHGSPSYIPATGVEEIEQNQNGLESNINSEGTVYQSGPSYVDNVNIQTGNSHKEIETADSTLTQVLPSTGQTSVSKYEKITQQNSNKVISNVPSHTGGHLNTGILDLSNNDNQNTQQQDLHTFVSSKVPSKVTVNSQTEQKEYHYGSSGYGSDVNNLQKEHKYTAIPVGSKIVSDTVPIKIRYVYDGKTLVKTEEYSSGAVKTVPIGAEEYENTMKEIHRQVSASHPNVAQPVSHEKPESDGYYYPKHHSSSQSYKKEESQSSHSQQTVSGGDVEQFSHLPLNVNSQKQYYTHTGYTGVIPPAGSQIKTGESQFSQGSQTYGYFPPLLVGGEPQLIPAQSEHSSSSSSSYHSSSSSGSHGVFNVPGEFNSGAAGSHFGDGFEKISSQVSGVPHKSSYGIATSFSSSSTNVNGKKSENRQASVTVNDNGKVDTYKVKS